MNVNKNISKKIKYNAKNTRSAKNFKITNVIAMAASFVVYFFVSGFAGKLAVLFTAPFVKFFTRNAPSAESVILYVVSVLAMFSLLCFFSAREGGSDRKLLRFSKVKALWSYIIASLIFLAICLVLYYGGFANVIGGNENENESICEYFFEPYFISEGAFESLENAQIGGKYFIADFFDLLASSVRVESPVFFLVVTLILCFLLIYFFYTFGCTVYMKKQDKAIRKDAESKMDLAMKMALLGKNDEEDD